MDSAQQVYMSLLIAALVLIVLTCAQLSKRLKLMASRSPSPPRQLLAATMDPSTALLQDQSPLFSKLPPEVRNLIFHYALQASHHPDKAYTKGTLTLLKFYYRPSHTSAPLIGTTLLRACRRIYLEVAGLLASQNALTYWWARPPPLEPACRNPVDDLLRLSPEHRAAAQVQVFVQQCHLEGNFQSQVLRHRTFRPAKLTITLRHSDWWRWEDDAPLGLDPRRQGRAPAPARGSGFVSANQGFQPGSWGEALRCVAGLRTFALELETVAPKKAQLDRIVEHLSTITFDMADGADLVFDPRAKTVSGWSGVNRFYDAEKRENAARAAAAAVRRRVPGQPRLLLPPGPLLRPGRGRRRVFVDDDGVVQGELGTRNEHGVIDDQAADAEKLEYYVVELVWRRQEREKEAQ